ncbi:MAG: AAA family ATPase [Myxococcales bacterium]
MTVFVGEQGTGKSLVAQVLFCLDELPFLMAYANAERGSQKKKNEVLFRSLLDRLRSSERRFATFAPKNVEVAWRRADRGDWPSGLPHEFRFNAYGATRAVTVRGPSEKGLAKLRGASDAVHHAVFVPTERIVYSQLRSAMGKRLLSLPITYDLFDLWIDRYQASEADDNAVQADIATVNRLGREALGGHARRYGRRWMWDFKADDQKASIDLDLASSGQKANWVLPHLAGSLLALRGTNDLAEGLTLFVEEPEIHLHPRAQRAMVEMLALLVNRGFRVVVTTHSLTVLYALNNLLHASRLGQDARPDVPDKDFRLDPRRVSIYAFHAGKEPQQLVDLKEAFIDERELGWVSDELSEELNRIGSQVTGWRG